jgi:hypothetical protein
MEKLSFVNSPDSKSIRESLGISVERKMYITSFVFKVARRVLYGGDDESYSITDGFNELLEYACTQAEAIYMTYMLGRELERTKSNPLYYHIRYRARTEADIDADLQEQLEKRRAKNN